jgi:hypothetical protein
LIAVIADTHMPKGKRALPESLEIELGGHTIVVVHNAGPAKGRLARMRARFASSISGFEPFGRGTRVGTWSALRQPTTRSPDRKMASSAAPGRLLAIYLNDHLAGATLGVELARRLRASNRGDAEMGEPLARICAEIEADHDTLIRLMDRLGVERDRVKPLLARLGERLGRLKLNGQLRGYSPLSRALELEVLSAGIGGKMQLWNALEQRFGESLDGFDFHALAERADHQGQRVEDLHLTAATRALGGGH